MQNKLLSRSFLLRCPRTLPCRCVLGVLSPASEKVSEKELQRDPRSSLVRKMPISASPGPRFTRYLLDGFTLCAHGSWEHVLLLLAPVPADQWLRCRCSPCLLCHLPRPGPIGRMGMARPWLWELPRAESWPQHHLWSSREHRALSRRGDEGWDPGAAPGLLVALTRCKQGRAHPQFEHTSFFQGSLAMTRGRVSR